MFAYFSQSRKNLQVLYVRVPIGVCHQKFEMTHFLQILLPVEATSGLCGDKTKKPQQVFILVEAFLAVGGGFEPPRGS
jgi:hypothetical protein